MSWKQSTSEVMDKIFVDKEGIPHWDGEHMSLLRGCKKRNLIEYETSTEERKMKTLALRLTRGLT